MFVAINRLTMPAEYGSHLEGAFEKNASGMAGVAGFLLSRANAWDVWTSLLGVLVMSFGGAKVLEAFASKE